MKAIYAVGKTNTYYIQKGTHFKKNEFLSAIDKAIVQKSTNYNVAVHDFLTQNQKKYGYTYKRERTKIK